MAMKVRSKLSAVAVTAGLLVGGLGVQQAMAQTGSSSGSSSQGTSQGSDASSDDGTASTTRDDADCPHDDTASSDA